MKKIIGLIVCLAFVSSWATHNTFYRGITDTVRNTPCNISMKTLHTKNTNDYKDTIVAAYSNYYGPYDMALTKMSPMSRYLTISADLITGTSPTMQVAIGFLSTNNIADTVAAFVPLCTLGTAAIQKTFDLSSYGGKACVIRVNNYDGTQCEIPGFLGIIFKEDITYTKPKSN